MSVESFGTERDDIQGNRFQKLKMKKDDELRVGVLYFDAEGKKFFLGAKAHVKKDTKTFLCKSTKEKKEICCTHSWEGNVPRMHVGCVLIVYTLGKDANGKTSIKSYEILPWIFWEKMYQKLASADKEFPLALHDLKLKCTNEEFTTIDIQSCKESIWSSNPNFKKKIQEEAKATYESISKNLGAELSITEIKEILGIEVTGSNDAASDVDLGSVMSSLD